MLLDGELRDDAVGVEHRRRRPTLHAPRAEVEADPSNLVAVVDPGILVGQAVGVNHAGRLPIVEDDVGHGRD